VSEGAVLHAIRQYSLERGSLEIEYLEQYFDEFQEKKTAREILQRLSARQHLILIALAPALDEPEHMVPVAFKVGHELRALEDEPQLMDLAQRLEGCVQLAGRRVFYSWIGGTRQEWRGRGHYRALTEQQEEWAHRNGFEEIVVKTKNKFHAMRATLDHLQFNVLKFERHPYDNAESKLYLHKLLSPELLREHRTARHVQIAA
jgi:GNAT superfamily N-acetyltransferase